jgi:hypothetical protein
VREVIAKIPFENIREARKIEEKRPEQSQEALQAYKSVEIVQHLATPESYAESARSNR